MLEAGQHSQNQFVTLTYNDENLRVLPRTDRVLPTLNPRDLVLFNKRMRKWYEPLQYRVFCIGEYGDESWRPHWHFAGFNFPPCDRGETKKGYRDRCMWKECCPTCRVVGSIWGKGDIEVRNLDESKCEYLAKYVVKKMGVKEDDRLDGRFPERSYPSRGPGVGVLAVLSIVEELRKWNDLVDVPQFLEMGKKKLPLGRLMRGKIREGLGLSHKAPPEELYRAWQEQVLPVLMDARADPQKYGLTIKSAFAVQNEGYDAALKFKQSLKKGRL